MIGAYLRALAAAAIIVAVLALTLLFAASVLVALAITLPVAAAVLWLYFLLAPRRRRPSDAVIIETRYRWEEEREERGRMPPRRPEEADRGNGTS
jgi:membrane protein implicated in regulation of membrane protease activity